MYTTFSATLADIERQMPEHFPSSRIITDSRVDVGFYRIGDAALAGIQDASVISATHEALLAALPDVQFHYNVARDGYDDAIGTIR